MQNCSTDFQKKSVERWHMGHRRNLYVLVKIRRVRFTVRWGTVILSVGGCVTRRLHCSIVTIL